MGRFIKSKYLVVALAIVLIILILYGIVTVFSAAELWIGPKKSIIETLGHFVTDLFAPGNPLSLYEDLGLIKWKLDQCTSLEVYLYEDNGLTIALEPTMTTESSGTIRAAASVLLDGRFKKIGRKIPVSLSGAPVFIFHFENGKTFQYTSIGGYVIIDGICYEIQQNIQQPQYF